MKKLKMFFGTLAIFSALTLISSCKSIETAVTTAEISVPASEAHTVTGIPIENGDFGGIALDTGIATAADALPFPEDTTSVSEAETEASGSDTTTKAAETTTTTAAATTTATSTATTTTTAATASKAPETAAATAATTTKAPETTTAVKTAEAQKTTAVTTTEATTMTATTPATEKNAVTTDDAPAGSGSYRRNSYKAVNHARVKAVWISYIELANHLSGKDEAGFRKGFAAMLDNCAGFGINTVYLHVRAFGDAYYYSSLFPFTKHLSGTVGKRTSYDPLKIMLSEAHARGMSFHAWINPLRLGSEADVSAIPSNYPVGKWYAGLEKGKYIVKVNGTWYLNPAYGAVRKLIGDNVREIVSGYDVDGIHIDDYFYPTTDASFDSAAFAESGFSSLSAFRVASCSAMVKEMYTAAHECGSAWFGAAPQGNNINNLNQLYADTKAWSAGGYIDYFTPQIYYGFENAGVPFASCVNEWAAIVKGTGIKLYAGLSVYKAGTEDKWAGSGKYEWQSTDTMLRRQTEYAEANGCGGIALYSYSYLFDSGYKTAATKAEADNLKPLLTK